MSDELLPGVIGALIGALVGGVVTAWFARQSERTTAAMEFLREWHSAEMRRYRSAAMRGCSHVPEAGILGNWSSATDDEKHAITVVAGFFERMSFLVGHREVNLKLARQAFGGLVAYWVPLLAGVPDPAYKGEWRPLFNRLTMLAKRLKSSTHEDAALYKA